jgi:hypothetical protein
MPNPKTQLFRLIQKLPNPKTQKEKRIKNGNVRFYSRQTYFQIATPLTPPVLPASC